MGSEATKRNFIYKRKKKLVWILEEESNTLQMCFGIMDF